MCTLYGLVVCQYVQYGHISWMKRKLNVEIVLRSMNQRNLCLLLIAALLINDAEAMSRQQMKNSLKMLKKQCVSKTQVAEDLIVDIEKGKFIEDKNVMCYIACIYQMSQIVKNNKLNYEASLKQVDLMYPPDLKDAAKKSITNCKDVSKKYKDLCEASYWSAKCVYEDDPSSFIFP